MVLNQVGSQVTGGVNLVTTLVKEGSSGPGQWPVGYAYGSPTGSNNCNC